MILLVGLGNPTPDSHENRHNIGFKIVDCLSTRFEGTFTKEKYGDVAKFKIKGHQIIVLKPTTFMNLSGKAVRYHLDLNKIKIENVLVASDDLHLPFGSIKIKRKGSDGGHNGHKDIIRVLNTLHYTRLKFGISSDFVIGEQSKYVLNSWSKEEQDVLEEVCKSSAEKLSPFYTLMKKMAEDAEFREHIIDTIDETLTEQKNDIKTDT